MKKKGDFQRFWEKAGKQLLTLGDKVAVVAKDIKEDAFYGAKISKLKVEEMDLEYKKNKLLQSVGNEAYKLVKAKKLSNAKIAKICSQIETLDKNIKKKRAESSVLKSKISKSIKGIEQSSVKKSSKRKKK